MDFISFLCNFFQSKLINLNLIVYYTKIYYLHVLKYYVNVSQRQTDVYEYLYN